MNEYNNLKSSFKRILNRFRLRLLLSDLLTGGLILFLFVLVYLSLYSFVPSFSFITVSLKTALYLLFLTVFFSLTFFYFLRPLCIFILSFNLKKDLVLNRLLNYIGGPKDVFVSLYHLAFRSHSIWGDEALKKAAFIQKFKVFTADKIPFKITKRKLTGKFFILLALSFILFLNTGFYIRIYKDLTDYTQVSGSGLRLNFYIQNKSLNVEYGKPFDLELKIESDFPDIDHVFICFGGGEFLMRKKDSLYTYRFDVVNNDIRFNFKTAGFESNYFKINVLPSPEITGYTVTLTPPEYTGIKTEVFKDVVDFRALYGSLIKFSLDLSAVDTLFLQSGDKLTLIALSDQKHAVFSRKILASGEYGLYGSNRYFSRKNLLNFNVTCIPDLYPGIQVSTVRDSLKTSVSYFYGVITDDYGFSALRFNYSLDGKTNTVVPIRIIPDMSSQEFYFEFDFAEFAGMDQAKVNYYFEVFDNDAISGPKSMRSDQKEYSVPDLNTIFDYNAIANNQINETLSETEKLAKEIVAGVKDLQKKMLDNAVDNWEKQQLAKDIVEKKEKLDKLLSAVRDENLKKSALNNSFTRQDSLLLSKQQKMQELLDRIMDDEMKKLMEEFSQLSQEFSKDKFQQLDEKMKLSFDQMSEELDRNIELLKRYQVEEQHEMISKQTEQLKQQQKSFEELSSNKSVDKDSLSSLAENLKNKLENIKKNYSNILEDNQKLLDPYTLKSLDKQFDDLSQQLDKQKENSENGKKDNALAEDIEEKMEEILEDIEQQQQQNFQQMSLPESDIELIIQNILLISLSQEDLIKQFSGVPAQSAKYNELGRLQDLKKLEYKIVKDSLSVLAKNNLMLASILSDKFYDIEIKFGLLPDYIQNNKRGELTREQQYIVTYLNDIALSLSDALQQGKSQQSGSGKGKDKDGKKGKGNGSGGKDEGYGTMKKIQNGLKRQMESLISQMKNGEKGKPLQQGISKMIRNNELFRKSLNDFMMEGSALSPGEKQLLNEINALLEDNIRDLSNYSVTNNLINRDNQIYNKLLLSEKASKEREEYEEKRKSVTASDLKYKRPEIYFKKDSKSGMIRTDFKKSDIRLNPFYKNMYNNYYIKLGDE